MQPDPAHCEAEANASAMAEQGANVVVCQTMCAVGCAVRTRGCLCWEQLQEICGACDVSEPPNSRESLG